MYSNSHNFHESNYSNKNKRVIIENKPIKSATNYNSDRFKQISSDTQQNTDDYYTDHSYNSNKRKEKPSSYYFNKKTTTDENSNRPRQNINYKYRPNNKILPSFNENTNDVIKINTITYFSETNDLTKGRVSPDRKINNFESNNFLASKATKDNFSKNTKVLNRVELSDKKKNISNTSKKDSSFKSHKTRSNFSNDIDRDIHIEEKIARYVRRNEQNERFMSCNETNLKNIYFNKLNNNEEEKEKEKEKIKGKENIYGKLPPKSSYNCNFVKINNYEFTYESDQGEKKTFNSKNKKKNIILNYKKSKDYKYNICYSNIILEDSTKYNNNNYEEIRDTFNSIPTTKRNDPYKFQIAQSINLNNLSKKTINEIDSFDPNEIYNTINNKSITFGNLNKPRQKNLTKTYNYSGMLKKNKIIKVKGTDSQVLKNLTKFNNNSIGVNNINKKKHVIREDYNTLSNISADNAPNTISMAAKKNSNTSINNHNSSRLKKKTGNIISNKKKGKPYFCKSNIKKIILIQSVYRTHMLNSRISGSLNFYIYINKLYNLLKLIFTFRLNYYWKLFIGKVKKNVIKKIIKNARVKNYSIKKNKNPEEIFGVNNKLLLKPHEGKNLYKELVDSYKNKNDNNGLKLKLDNMIKENNELKNKIFHNKTIEEKLKQLLLENKKNQNINAIIMKDNQHLAKKLKIIQDSRNYQLIIQNQPSLDLSQENNIQKQPDSVLKYKKLCIKCLILNKILKNKNILKIYFNKYKNRIINIQKEKQDQTTIENNNIFINNRKKINIQMTKNFNINFISQKDNYKHFVLDKLFMKKEEIKKKTLSKFFFKFIYISKYFKLYEDIKAKEKEINEEKENEIKVEEEEKEDKNELKRSKLQSIINKYERNYNILFRNLFKEWKLRGIIFKMKRIAKDIKKKKKLKKKIREKIARATLNSLKKKSETFQSAHEFSYIINKQQELENIQNDDNKDPKNNKQDTNDKQNKITEDNKNENNNNNNIDNTDEQDYSESSFGLDD